MSWVLDGGGSPSGLTQATPEAPGVALRAGFCSQDHAVQRLPPAERSSPPRPQGHAARRLETTIRQRPNGAADFFSSVFLADEKRNIKYLYPQIAAQIPRGDNCELQHPARRGETAPPAPLPEHPRRVLPRWVTRGDGLCVPKPQLRAAMPTQRAQGQGSPQQLAHLWLRQAGKVG